MFNYSSGHQDLSISDINKLLPRWPKLQHLQITTSHLNKQLLDLDIENCPCLMEISVNGGPEQFGISLSKPNDLNITAFSFTPKFLIGDGSKAKEVTGLYLEMGTFKKGQRTTLIKDYFTGMKLFECLIL